MSTGSPDRVTVYTDGAFSPTRKTGGWGAVIRHGGQPVEISDGEVEAITANRMEITAALRALNRVTELAGSATVHLVTDSTYLRDGIGYLTSKSKSKRKPSPSNPDLWLLLGEAVDAHTKVTCEWVSRDAGDADNERADELAHQAQAEAEDELRQAKWGPRAPEFRGEDFRL